MKRSAGLLVLVTVLQFHPTYTDLVVPDDHTIDFKDGDVLIGYIYKYSKSSSAAIQASLILSFLAAVQNEEYHRIPGPGNHTIGYVIWTAYSRNLDFNFITQMLYNYPKIVALIGLPLSEQSQQMSPYVDDLKIPTYVVASPGIAFDKVKELSSGKDYLIQITSKQSSQIHGAIPGILHKLGSNVITVVYEQETDLVFSELNIGLQLKEPRVEIEDHIRLENNYATLGYTKSKTVDIKELFPNFGVLEEHLEHMSEEEEEEEEEEEDHHAQPRVHTLVLLLKRGVEYRRIIEWLVDQDKIRNMVIISGSAGCLRTWSSYVKNLRALSERNIFVYRLCQTSFEDDELTNFISNYTLYRSDEEGNVVIGNKNIDKLYKDEYDHGDESCFLTNTCISMTSLSEFDNYKSSYTYRVFHGTKKIVRAIQQLNSTQIEEVSKRSFTDLILNKSSVGEKIRDYFRGNDNGTDGGSYLSFTNYSMVQYFDVVFEEKNSSRYERWSSDEQQNSDFETLMEETKSHIMNETGLGFWCSDPCDPGNKTLLDRRFSNCWECIPCSGNTVSPNGTLGNCAVCNSTRPVNATFLWANPARTECTTPARSVNPGTTAGKVVLVMAGVNLATLLFTIGVYIKYWKNRVIVSSGRDLSTIMFIGLIIGHVEAILIAMEPTFIICKAIQILSHIFMMLTVVPLTVKTYRIWFVFKFSAKLGSRLKSYIANWVMMLACGVLMLPQVACLVLGFVWEKSHNFGFKINYVEESLDDPIVVTKSCGPGSFTLMLGSIVYTGVLLLLSTVLGWDCRKIPDNFKESMHIFVCSLISLLLVTIYVPAMLTMAGFTQVALLAGVISIISLTLNVVIFLPKIYVVLFVPVKKQRELFKSKRLSKTSLPVTKMSEVEL